MFRINGKKVEVECFPDGTKRFPRFELPSMYYDTITKLYWYHIFWNKPTDEECMVLYFLVNHIRNKRSDARIKLTMPYVLNARMDRVETDEDVFTLKYFCNFINDLKFDEVEVLDAHSNVSLALLNNVKSMDVNYFIEESIKDIEGYYIDGGKLYGGKSLIYFPDDGAMKRYSNLRCFLNRDICYGKKHRDWETGKITGLEIYNKDGEKIKEEDVKGRTVLMIDDIVSYGGTLAYSADELKRLGADAIYAYATHAENSVLDEEKGTLLKRLKEGTVDGVFTTNSIFDKENEYFIVYKIFNYD